MDREVAFRQLCDYWSQVGQALKLPRFAGQRGPALDALNKQLPVINRILRELAPDVQPLRAQWISDHAATWPRISRALQIINAWREVEKHQWTGGGPVFPLSLLDPVISEVAIPLWAANKFRQAVGDAATSLSHFAQQRLDRTDVSDTSLMTEAFSNDPPKPGRPRLRCPGDHRLTTIKDQQNGARQVATGAFLAIRNPAHHMTGEWNPITAFHYMTILSQVAHYFRHWDVVPYVPPPPDLSVVMAQYQKSLAQQKPVTLPGQTSASPDIPCGGRRGSGKIAPAPAASLRSGSAAPARPGDRGGRVAASGDDPAVGEQQGDRVIHPHDAGRRSNPPGVERAVMYGVG